MEMSVSQWILSLSGLLLQALLAWAMAKRGLRKQFPAFFNYTVAVAFSTVIELAVFGRGSAEQYFYAYWCLTGCTIVLAFVALYEVFQSMLKPYSALRDLSVLLFVWVAGFLVLTAVITALATSGDEVSRMCAAITMLERVLRLMECGLLLLIVVFDSKLGLSWRSYAISIALGLGSIAAVDLTVSYLLPRLSGWESALSNLHVFAFNCVAAAWAVNFMLPQPARSNVSESPTRLIFQRWNEVLMATPLVSRRAEVTAFSAVESFLPGVERTVERIMAQKMH